MPTYFRNKLWTDEEREQLWLQKLNKQTRYVRGEKIDVLTMEGEREYDQALKYRQDENVALGYPAEPWNLKKYKKSLMKYCKSIWIVIASLLKKVSLKSGFQHLQTIRIGLNRRIYERFNNCFIYDSFKFCTR